ncbi:MAG: type II toxin-antitoxin system Phd/YefM family antitoxin [Thermomicrobiales bacterium]
MKSVGVYEAKTQLSRLLDEVDDGETVEITKHGRLVARLVPPDDATKPNADAAIAAIRAARVGVRLDGLTIRELIEEGRM